MAIKELGKKLWMLDGSMGNLLFSRVEGVGKLPEEFGIEAPEVIQQIHREYAAAGSDIICTNTFGANPIKLSECPYSLKEVMDAAYDNAKKGAPDKQIFLDVGPTGKLLEPIGDASFDAIYECYKEVAIQSNDYAFDGVLIETMSDVLEAKAAVLAFKEHTDLPVLCTMTFQEDGRTLNGTDPETMINILEGLGVDGVGMNCSLGPVQLEPIVKAFIKHATAPIVIQPNAGMPSIIDGKTVYDVDKDVFAKTMAAYVDMGIGIVGGCCGTTPAYIQLLKTLISDKTVIQREKKPGRKVSSSTKTIDMNKGITIIGERINPAGKPLLREAIKKEHYEVLIKEAITQKQAGAEVLDVNISVKGGDDKKILEEVVKSFSGIIDCPIQFDNTKPEALERAIRLYAGVPIINSVNGKQSSMDGIFPIAKKYGAMVIALALDENGIPETAEDRFNIAKRIIDAGVAYGIPREKFIVDCLTLSAASDMTAANDTFTALKRVKEELGVLTTLGASNASFGLPTRDILNSVYLTMAFAHGLDAPITDPTCPELQKSIYGVRFFKNEEIKGDTFLNKYGNVVERQQEEKSVLSLKEIVIDGLKEEALAKTKVLLKTRTPDDVIDNELIPALDYVGKKFEKGELFLPQLLRCAETVKESFEAVKAAFSEHKIEVTSKGKIVLATVEGDVHDIGKNIVKILLENYGFEVIDLGKDVPAEKIVEATKEHDVKLVGLSALMTTTVPFMERTIQALSSDSDINAKVLVGGAVLTQEYADEIGADFYAKDARETVRIAQEILNVSKI